MTTLRKIMAMMLVCVLALSFVSVNAMAVDNQWTIVELDGTKKVVEIELELKEDMFYWLEMTNKGEDDAKFSLVGAKDQVLPEGVATPGMGIGTGCKDGSTPLPAGKYTIKLESLGKSNIKGIFKYQLSASASISSPDGEDIVWNNGEAFPLIEPIVTFMPDPENFAIGKLAYYGVVEGDLNGDTRPYDTITRAEMAKVLCKMLGLTPDAPKIQTFSDVNSSHWAYNYIECINAKKIIEGNGDGTFSPEDNVLFKDAIKMIVSAMGYAPQAEQVGGYPYGYSKVATQLGITKNIDNALDVECIRNTAFKMLYNAIDVPFMMQTGFVGGVAEYQIADGKEGREHITFRGRITGNPESGAER